jgi:hypothetical protein
MHSKHGLALSLASSTNSVFIGKTLDSRKTMGLEPSSFYLVLKETAKSIMPLFKTLQIRKSLIYILLCCSWLHLHSVHPALASSLVHPALSLVDHTGQLQPSLVFVVSLAANEYLPGMHKLFGYLYLDLI